MEIVQGTTVQKFCVFSLLLSLFKNSAFALDFNTMGLEHCIFNLVDAEVGSSKTSTDLLERILISNQGNQVWTIIRLAFFKQTNHTYEFWASRYKRGLLYDTCRVNFFLQIEQCVDTKALNFFGKDELNPRNIFILILLMPLLKISQCSKYGLHYKYYRKHANFFYLYLSKEQDKIGFAYTFCSTCTLKNVIIPNPTPNLNELVHFSKILRSGSVVAIIAALTVESS